MSAATGFLNLYKNIRGENNMTKMNQKEAVYTTVMNIIGEYGLEGVPAQVINKEHRGAVNAVLFEGFKSGMIELEREFSDTELKAYVSGLVSNWLRKDKRLNGGVQYVAKNPGSRTGSTDAMLKSLRALKSTLTDPSDIAEVEKHIALRIAELKPAKQQPSVDYSALPAELAAKFKK
jgi:hypothetical protein